ncbi:hypothetical protein [Celerinatantimonas diazotrophica]|uniref:Uncharacterized protein n=1 Tax=Celerinatantimonas diazotrophica TaxID=412034 RepID=A0A4R1JAD1_9GAMM|nr:hypothetical protein [Celerinatantimonas diazotrophica]TCK47490.1 hypothetical protein EV690_2517 [Celerinatantimonas diazotrophica]CAG9296892.1 hypothetical protein CEDIAZO_02054 [Celerinatantimonas diazotrophica]
MILSLANQLSFQQKTYVLLLPFVVLNLFYIEQTNDASLQILLFGGLSLVIIRLNQAKFRYWIAYLLYGYIALHNGHSSALTMLHLELFLLLALLLLYNDWLMVVHNLLAGFVNVVIILAFLTAGTWHGFMSSAPMAFAGH